MTWNVFDYILIAANVGMLLYGVFTGFIRRISGTISLAVAFMVTAFTYQKAYDVLHLTHTYEKYIAYIVIFVLCYIVFKTVLKKASNRISKWPIVGGINRLLGGVLGVLQGILMSVVLIVFVNIFNFDAVNHSLIAQWVLHFIR